MNLQVTGVTRFMKNITGSEKILPRDYLWPIPNNEVLENDPLKQNTDGKTA